MAPSEKLHRKFSSNKKTSICKVNRTPLSNLEQFGKIDLQRDEEEDILDNGRRNTLESMDNEKQVENMP